MVYDFSFSKFSPITYLSSLIFRDAPISPTLYAPALSSSEDGSYCYLDPEEDENYLSDKNNRNEFDIFDPKLNLKPKIAKHSSTQLKRFQLFFLFILDILCSYSLSGISSMTILDEFNLKKINEEDSNNFDDILSEDGYSNFSSFSFLLPLTLLYFSILTKTFQLN